MKALSRMFAVAAALAAALALISGCVPKQQAEPTAPPTAALPVDDQEKLAMDTFQNMLELTVDHDRQAVIPEIENGYYKIINDYPKSYLAEEAHLRLMLMYLEDFDPSREEDAERIYRQYFERYQNPKLTSAMNEYLARHYYFGGRWEKLARFLTPFMREYANTGKLANSLFLFFYTEAKFNLKDFDEAEKGYRAVHKLFPNSSEAKLSVMRLKHISDLRSGGISNSPQPQPPQAPSQYQPR